MGVAVMAKKKATKAVPAQGASANMAVTLRGSAEWKAWVEGLAQHTRLDVAKVIDRALIDFAEKEGYDREAPSR